MIATSEDALICDFAETYGIYDWRSLPITLAATLASGLRADSRIKMEMRGDKATPRDTLLAGIYDALVGVIWARAGAKGNPPPSAYAALIGESKGSKDREGKEALRTYRTPEAFERARARIIAGRKQDEHNAG